MKHGYGQTFAPIKGVLPDGAIVSIGIFELIPKASGRGTRKGPVKVRVIGDVSNEAAVKAKVLEIVELLDNGKYLGPKNVKIW